MSQTHGAREMVRVRGAYSERVEVYPAKPDYERFGAKQSFKEECDINNIMRRYVKTQTLTHIARVAPHYGDFSGFDFMEAHKTIAVANEAFAALPAVVRKRFANDPAEFFAFVQEKENIDELRKMGLAKPKPKEEPKAKTLDDVVRVMEERLTRPAQ